MMYYEVKNKYLAEALAFLGFKYYKHDNLENGKIEYTFENTPELHEAMQKLIKYKRELKLY